MVVHRYSHWGVYIRPVSEGIGIFADDFPMKNAGNSVIDDRRPADIP